MIERLSETYCEINDNKEDDERTSGEDMEIEKIRKIIKCHAKFRILESDRKKKRKQLVLIVRAGHLTLNAKL